MMNICCLVLKGKTPNTEAYRRGTVSECERRRQPIRSKGCVSQHKHNNKTNQVSRFTKVL